MSRHVSVLAVSEIETPRIVELFESKFSSTIDALERYIEPDLGESIAGSYKIESIDFIGINNDSDIAGIFSKDISHYLSLKRLGYHFYWYPR